MMNMWLNFKAHLALAVAGWLNRLLPDVCHGPVVAVIIGEVFEGKGSDVSIHVIDHGFLSHLTDQQVVDMMRQG